MAGSLSVATAASATAATWTSGAAAHARIAGPSAGPPAGVASVPRLAVTDQLALPSGEVTYQLVSGTLAQPAYQVRTGGARYAVAAPSQSAAPPTSGISPKPVTAVTASALSGSPRHIARAMLGSFGWSARQFACLDPLWAHESGWSLTAENPSGAYGIPQALPGSKMASAGPHWQTNAATQIKWGLRYIRGSYGSPCGAWDHEQATGWY